jgi:hypothetical protein
MGISVEHGILIFLLVTLAALYLTGVIRTQTAEGFRSSIVPVPNICQPGYTFFTDKLGVSMCCRGAVDPYKNTCKTAGALEDLCAFTDNVPDPRDPKRMLSLCSNLYTTAYKQSARAFCTKDFPHFASDGLGNDMCCKSLPVSNGSRCTQNDLSDKRKFCVVRGHRNLAGRRCKEVKMFEESNCPPDMKKTTMQVGERERNKYTLTKTTAFPVCMNMTDTCISDPVLNHLKADSLFTKKNNETWKYSCSAYKRRNIDRDQTFTMDVSYP